MNVNFLDTCSLLHMGEKVLDRFDTIHLSYITIKELENIKTGLRDEAIKYAARKVVRMIENNEDRFFIVFLNEDHFQEVRAKYSLIDNNDGRIVATAALLKDFGHDVKFISKDLLCSTIAKSFCHLDTEYIMDETKDLDYKGWIELSLSNDEMAEFYQNSYESYKFNEGIEVLPNEYVIIKEKESGKYVDLYKVSENLTLTPFNAPKMYSKMFGKVKPLDIYQKCAMDSLVNNQMTILRGRAGSGKDYCCFAYMLSALEKGEYSQIVAVGNPVGLRGAAEIGFRPGRTEEKLMESSLGNILIGKLGNDTVEIERLLNQERLRLLPACDVRGMDLTGSNCILYITEAQNYTIDLLKTLIQRVGEDCKLIINGDDFAQVDKGIYEGNNNGLKRAVEIFKGVDFFGTVYLPIIHRSKMAEIADKM